MQRLSDRLMIYTLKFIPASGNCICHKTAKTYLIKQCQVIFASMTLFWAKANIWILSEPLFWYRTSAFQQYHQSWKQLNSKASQLFQKNIFQILSGFWLQRDIMGDLLSYQSVLCECHLMQTLAPNSTQTFTISPFLF